MRHVLLVLVLIIAGSASAKPPIIITNVTAQCDGNTPVIVATLDPLTASSWSGSLYFHVNPPSAGTAWPPATNPLIIPVPAAPNPGNLIVTNDPSPSTSGAGIVPSNVVQYNVATCGGGTAHKGLTWIHSLSNAQTGTITVGCGGTSAPCDAYHGDTLCTQQLPLLCIYKPSPPFPVPAGVNNSDQYNKWAGGVVATTQPVAGNSFPTLNDANQYCAAQFGSGWQVAEFHDGWGWHFQAYGGTVSAPTVPSTRFWVHINDQPAHCWQ